MSLDPIKQFNSMDQDQVRKHKWTDDELDHLVAVKVMGWELKLTIPECEDCGCKVPYYFCKVGKNTEGQIKKKDWHPSTDMNDAMMAARKFDRFEILTVHLGEELVRLFLPKNIYPFESRAKPLSRAICIAALIAEKEKK